MGKPYGWDAADPPARHRGRELIERITRGLTPATQQEHRGRAITGGKLEPAGRGLVGDLHLGDHCRKAAVAQCVLGQRQRHYIVTRLSIEQAVWPQPRLLKAWRVKVQPGQRPNRCTARLLSKSRRDAGDEQCGGGIIAKRRRTRTDLMERGSIEPAASQPIVQHLNAKWKHLGTPG